MELISVVVPVYNVEKYLEQCVESIRNQTYPALEILLIDDGSTDGSGALCDALAECDERIRVIHRENRGVSAVRNFGARQAKGKYVTFLDSDDVLHPRYAELLLSIKAEGCFSCCAMQAFQGEFRMPDAPEPDGGRELSSAEAMGILNGSPGKGWGVTLVTAPAKLYDRELLLRCSFPEGIRHEDEYVIHRWLGAVQGVTLTDAPLYYYRQHEESFMHSYADSRTHFSFLDALCDRADFCAGEFPELLEGAVHRLLWQCSCFYGGFFRKPGEENRQARKYLAAKYRGVYRKYFRQLSIGEKLKGALFSYWPDCYHILANLKFRK